MRFAGAAQVALLCALVACALAQSSSNGTVSISAPDIDPPGGTFVGFVQVTLLQQARDCVMHYTVDGTVPTAQSPTYSSPFTVAPRNTPVNVSVMAISVSTLPGRADSAWFGRTFYITTPTAFPPRFTPEPGTFREQVEVHLTAPSGVAVEYSLGVDKPWLPYRDQVLINHIGVHTLHARTKKDGQVSAPESHIYIVTPPLRYDVSSTCAACGNKPTKGEWFTVWLQNAVPGSRLRLTTSSTGCEREDHWLDQTPLVATQPRRLSYKFRSYADPGKVFVCLSEPGTSRYTVVRRRSTHADDDFDLQKAVRQIDPSEWQRSWISDTPAPDQSISASSVSPVIAAANILLWGVLITVVVLAVRAYRRNVSHAERSAARS